MPTAAKTLMTTTVVALVLVSAYSAALGGSGWLWFFWIVLGLVALGAVTTREH